jgi:hypothetical protein
MKIRALVSALVVSMVSMSTGCTCFHNCFPNVGWRFHEGCCPSACSPPVCCGHSGPVAFRPPMVVSGGPDCPSCAAGMSGMPGMSGMAGYQPAGFQPIPVIGNPMPIPGVQVIPGSGLPNPMPTNPKTGGN